MARIYFYNVEESPLKGESVVVHDSFMLNAIDDAIIEAGEIDDVGTPAQYIDEIVSTVAGLLKAEGVTLGRIRELLQTTFVTTDRHIIEVG